MGATVENTLTRQFKDCVCFPIKMDINNGVKKTKLPNKWNDITENLTKGNENCFAVLTGKRKTGSGNVFVIDLDKNKNENEISGVEWFENHIAKLDELDTFITKTPNGGFHIYYEYEEDIKTKIGFNYDNKKVCLDLLADGKCCYQGQYYPVFKDVDIAKIDDKLKFKIKDIYNSRNKPLEQNKLVDAENLNNLVITNFNDSDINPEQPWDLTIKWCDNYNNGLCMIPDTKLCVVSGKVHSTVGHSKITKKKDRYILSCFACGTTEIIIEEKTSRETSLIQDYDIACLFVKFRQCRLLYSVEEDTFYTCDDTTNIWEKDECSIVFKQLTSLEFEEFVSSNTVRDGSGKNVIVPKEVLCKFVRNSTRSSGVIRTLKNIVNKRVHFDAKKNYFAFNNGVYDLEANVFKKIEVEDYILTTCNHDYDPNKKKNFVIENSPSYAFVNSLFENKRIANYVIKSLTHGLWGEQRKKEFHIWTGSGDNGKSKLAGIVLKAVGDYGGTINPNAFCEETRNSTTANPELHQLRYKRIVLTSEPDDKARFNSSVLKRLSGKDDTITTRTLHEKPQEWIPKFNCFVLCNDIPASTDKTAGFSNRIKVSPFKFIFCKNPVLPNERLAREIELTEELVVDFLHLLLLFNSIEVEYPEELEEEKNEYLTDNDNKLGFINYALEKTANEQDTITTDDLYKKYVDWCILNNIETKYMCKQRGLTNYLKKKGYNVIKPRTNNKPFYLTNLKFKGGMDLIEEEDEE